MPCWPLQKEKRKERVRWSTWSDSGKEIILFIYFPIGKSKFTPTYLKAWKDMLCLKAPINHKPMIPFFTIYWDIVFQSEQSRLRSVNCSELMPSKTAAALMKMKSFGTQGRWWAGVAGPGHQGDTAHLQCRALWYRLDVSPPPFTW